MTRTVGELAEYLRIKLVGDGSAKLSGIAGPEDASATDLIYIDSPRHLERALSSRALCVLAQSGSNILGKTILETDAPKLAFAKAAAWLLPSPPRTPAVHPSAIVAASAKIADSATIGPYVVIEGNAEVGAESWIEAFCYMGAGTHVGENCRLHPRVTLYPGARVLNRVEIHSGSVIGGDGFGYVFGEGRHWKFPQAGTIEIADDVEIGCNTTIDRGSLGSTLIGSGTKIDNLVQIAHNVEIGQHSVIVAQTGVSGSSHIGKYVVIAGQVGLADHTTVEDQAMIGAQAGVPSGKTIRSGQVVWGTPARPLKKFKEQYAHLSRLPELAQRVRALEEKLAKNKKENAEETSKKIPGEKQSPRGDDFV